MVYNWGVSRILPWIASETAKRETKEKHKGKISGKFFRFLEFSNFWKFRNKFFVSSLKNVFDKLWILRSYAAFLLKWWHIIKRIWSMPLKCRYTRNIFWYILWLHKVLFFKRDEILSYSGLKKSYFTWQKYGIIWKMPLNQKI